MAASKTRRSRRAQWQWLLCVALLSGACDDDVQRSNERGVVGAAPAAQAAGGPVEKVEAVAFKDDDFVESDANRDPFRVHASVFRRGPAVEADAVSQRAVIMPNTPVEAMKLIAIISGVPRPKAMLVDPKNVGYVVERGDYIGSPKVVQAGGSVAMALNWRVDRIRENEVVLTRTDPTDPTRPPLSRIVALRN